MSLPHIEVVQQVPTQGPLSSTLICDVLTLPIGDNPPTPPEPVHIGTVPRDDGGAEGEDANRLGFIPLRSTPSRRTYNTVDAVSTIGEQSSNNIPKVLSFQPTGNVICPLAFVLLGN